ncbi:hypothetical protein QSE00_10310 [Arenibacter sp. M-2]|uniref:hypothetical protein n=1 Tax=Arenibacter sp. M-2 TaxID=3053612 RepID=UPI0025701FEF|nr:hypothetical protein [Arenibacter sp. M-2]MDL5512208.1 hypothetical protein [Arenibacter sp. M-2]|tara:strand:- start:120 stop:716 length:597 start_codon:yes stop_codon:yes gene_type:complete
MNRTVILSLLLIIGFISCKTSEREINRLEIAKNYYKALNSSDNLKMALLLTDSLVTKETEYNYVQTFSVEEFMEWLKWDAVFSPTYEILQMEQKDTIVKAKISKIDKRISFLHQVPIVTNQVIRFDNDKIISIETTEYIVFNDSTFVKNRDNIVSWIDENHPELNGFLHDQTETGGLKYLKAIELYKNKNNVQQNHNY